MFVSLELGLGAGFAAIASSSWVLSGAAVDMDFANARYFGGTLANLLSITRASNGYATNADGSLTNFGSNVLRVGVGTGLLIEEARTNLLQFSEDMTNGIWASNGGTLTGNVGVAPNGATTAGQIVAAAVNNGNYNTSSGVQGIATYTASGFMKLISGGPNLAFLASGQGPFGGTGGDRLLTFNGSTGAFVSKATEISSFTITPSVNGWFRVTATFTTTASSAINVGFFAGAAETFQAWGVQLEAGAFATSYIPTAGATATRATDAIQLTGAALTALAPTTNGWIVQQVTLQLPSLNPAVFLSGGPAARDIFIKNATQLYTSWNSANFNVIDGTPAWSTSVLTKMGLAWNATSTIITANGAAATTDATHTPNSNTFSSAFLGGRNGSIYMNGAVARLSLSSNLITAGQLQTLTT